MIDDEPRCPVEALRPQAELTVAHEKEQIGVGARLQDLTLGWSAPRLNHGWPRQPLTCASKKGLSLLGSDRSNCSPRLWRPVTAQHPALAGQLLHVDRRDMHEAHLSVGGQESPGLVDAGFPRALLDPDHRSHHVARRANHNATVEATSTGGTVNSPS